jgi:hypothetical protein
MRHAAAIRGVPPLSTLKIEVTCVLPTTSIVLGELIPA